MMNSPFCEFTNPWRDTFHRVRLFREFTDLGGFPEVLKTGDTTLLEYYYRDVISRYGIKNVREIREMALFLAVNPATIQRRRRPERGPV